MFSTKHNYDRLVTLAAPLVRLHGFLIAFANTRAVRPDKWLQHIGVTVATETTHPPAQLAQLAPPAPSPAAAAATPSAHTGKRKLVSARAAEEDADVSRLQRDRGDEEGGGAVAANCAHRPHSRDGDGDGEEGRAGVKERTRAVDVAMREFEVVGFLEQDADYRWDPNDARALRFAPEKYLKGVVLRRIAE